MSGDLSVDLRKYTVHRKQSALDGEGETLKGPAYPGDARHCPCLCPTKGTPMHTQLISLFLPGVEPWFSNVSTLHFLLEDDVPFPLCRPK